MNNNKLFFPALTGYRAIAAWMIFIYHFFPFKNESHSYPKWIANIVWEFHIGVDMFFVLSGFLITYRYFNENPIDFKKYMVNRFARIYPRYFLITVGVFISGYLTS
ncbi:acyltransferase, partial [Riemerella anatipestifer]|uniref:acyltransferase family protein n=1 Tax=Riemerella anatipestifer TaxID=34085 RepID=UPI0021D5F0B8